MSTTDNGNLDNHEAVRGASTRGLLAAPTTTAYSLEAGHG